MCCPETWYSCRRQSSMGRLNSQLRHAGRKSLLCELCLRTSEYQKKVFLSFARALSIFFRTFNVTCTALPVQPLWLPYLHERSTLGCIEQQGVHIATVQDDLLKTSREKKGARSSVITTLVVMSQVDRVRHGRGRWSAEFPPRLRASGFLSLAASDLGAMLLMKCTATLLSLVIDPPSVAG